MQQDHALFATITVAVLLAFLGGFVARKLKIPAIVGYLVAGLAISPFTPGFTADTNATAQLAEIGIIFMMFGVGLFFSLGDLWNVRKIAIPGALMQAAISTIIGFTVARLLWDWSPGAGLVLGLSISVASTAVLLRGLSDSGLLGTAHGRVAIGWLVFEDLITIVILVLLPALVTTAGNPLLSIGWALLKTALFAAIMMFVGTRAMAWLMTQIAFTRSRELFILAVITLALGTSYIANLLFGVSLALGAFLAGVVISGSEVHHQVGAEAVPFRDFFSVLFFVSVGMLVNPAAVLAHIDIVLGITLLIVVGKGLVTLLLGLFLPASARTMIVVAAGLTQIGEFSFIVGQTGVSLGLIDVQQYELILAAAVISIIVNPLVFRFVPTGERLLDKLSFLRFLDRGGPTPEPFEEQIEDHVIIVGYGRVGRHIGAVLRQLNVPFVVIDQDMARVSELQRQGLKAMFGDAANSEILTHVCLDCANALVVAVPDETSTELIVAAAHQIAPNMPIIARARTEDRLGQLAKLGVTHAINPEMEGGLELLRYTLLTLHYSTSQIQHYIDTARGSNYEGIGPGERPFSVLDQMLLSTRGVEIAWVPLGEDSPLCGQTLQEANIRSRIGASVVAVIRDQQVIANPKSSYAFQRGDLVGLIGETEELQGAYELINPGEAEIARAW